MKILRLTFIFIFLVSQVNAGLVQEKSTLSLSLLGALKMARLRNAQLIVANERVQQALAEISISRSALLPQVTGVFGGKRQTGDLRASGIKLPDDPHIGPFNSFDTRGRLTMNIFDPAAMSRLESAKAGQKLSQRESFKLRQDILALVGALYLEAQRAAQAIEFNQINLKHQEHQLTVAQLKFNQGTGSLSALYKAQVDLAQAQYALEASQTRVQKTRLDLGAALKIPLDQTIVFEDDHAWVHQELQQAQLAPHVALAQAQLVQNKADYTQARAEFLPKIIASGDYGRLGESPSASSNTYALGVSISVPIWEGGIKQAQLEKAQSKIKETEVLLEDAQDQNQMKIQQAQGELVRAEAFLRFKMQQMQYAQHQWEIAQEQLKNGLGNRLDLDQAEVAKAMSLDEKNEALAIFWTAKINLAHALGDIEQLFQGDL